MFSMLYLCYIWIHILLILLSDVYFCYDMPYSIFLRLLPSLVHLPLTYYKYSIFNTSVFNITFSILYYIFLYHCYVYCVIIYIVLFNMFSIYIYIQYICVNMCMFSMHIIYSIYVLSPAMSQEFHFQNGPVICRPTCHSCMTSTFMYTCPEPTRIIAATIMCL